MRRSRNIVDHSADCKITAALFCTIKPTQGYLSPFEVERYSAAKTQLIPATL